ncbi:MAG: hypothetical protein NCW75_08475 [Phycisphaera sp.]|nr:MAG: hypothetical protein NCW75_08475 [Phycisphaera sp.]
MTQGDVGALQNDRLIRLVLGVALVLAIGGLGIRPPACPPDRFLVFGFVGMFDAAPPTK